MKKKTKGTQYASAQKPNGKKYIPNSLIGGIGTVQEQISGQIRGRILYQNSRWFAVAQSLAEIKPGAVVRVVDVDNTTLIVEPVNIFVG